MKTRLIRQNYKSPDFKQLYLIVDALKGFLYENVDEKSDRWRADFESVISFQDVDGSFKLIDSVKVENDIRIDFCYIPTYICTAIIMKAYMWNHCIFEDMDKVLSNALNACCGRKLTGHGYEWLAGVIEALNIFKEAGLREFLMYHAGLCPEFSDMIRRLAAELKEMEDNANTTGPWGEDYGEEIRKLNEYFSHLTVFVYGTLQRGQRNHSYYLQDGIYLGKAQISGFDMFDTGSYPAIIPGKGIVKGELFEIAQDDLRKLDCLEGEGNLYIRKCVAAKAESGCIMPTLVYVYNRSIAGLYRIPEELQPYTEGWQDSLNNYVWYVSYGSNMLRERFMCYIKGGCFSGSSRYITACSDTAEPVAITNYDIPYDMYFGNMSSSWEGKGVSFLDLTKPGHAFGVAYLITREQLEHVACQENGGIQPEYSPNWYNEVKLLGTLEGHEAYTITNDSVREHNDPCESYLNTLHRGLAENFHDMSSDEIEEYLHTCIKH